MEELETFFLLPFLKHGIYETVERAVADVCGRIREVCELQRDRGEFDGRFWDEEWWTDK